MVSETRKATAESNLLSVLILVLVEDGLGAAVAIAKALAGVKS